MLSNLATIILGPCNYGPKLFIVEFRLIKKVKTKCGRLIYNKNVVFSLTEQKIKKNKKGC